MLSAALFSEAADRRSGGGVRKNSSPKTRIWMTQYTLKIDAHMTRAGGGAAWSELKMHGRGLA